MGTTSPFRHEIVSDHAQVADVYAGYWAYPDTRPEGMTEGEAAYHFLLHAGMLYRYTGERNVITPLTQLPFADRERLVTAGCRFLAESDTVARAKQISTEAGIDETTEAEFERYVYERDEIDVALRTVKTIGKDVLLRSGPARAAHWAALQAEFDLNQVLEDRAHRAVVVAVSEIVLGLRQHIVIRREDPNTWWCTRLQRMRDRFYAPTEIDRILIHS